MIENQDNLTNCIYRATKSERFYDISLTDIMYNSTPSLAVTITKISDKLVTYRRYELDEYKHKLMHSVTHNMKTPLNGMFCAIQCLLQEDSSQTKETQQIYQLILRNCKLMLSQINTIIDFNALENQDFLLSLSHCNIVDIMNKVKEIFCDEIMSKQI